MFLEKKINGLNIDIYADKGPCKENQDACCIASNKKDIVVAALCDGLGSYAGGKQAAEFVVKRVSQAWLDKNTEELLKINEEVRKDFSMGYTTVAAVNVNMIADSPQITYCNSGDTRIYLIGKGRMEQLSCDHTTEQPLRRAGCSESMALFFRQITHCIGMEKLEYYCNENILQGEELIMMATDGAWELFEKKNEWSRIIQLKTVEEKKKYIFAQLSYYTDDVEDNVTVMLLYFDEKIEKE